MTDVQHLAKSMALNPFIYNAPVRGGDFCNREEIIEKLLKETVRSRSQGNVWITGERQVGKTSLLRYIQFINEKKSISIKPYGADKTCDVAFIYLNVEDAETPDEFYRQLRLSLKNYFDFKVKNEADAYHGFIESLDYLYCKRNYFIVFLIDEFDAFIEHMAANDSGKATHFLSQFNKLSQAVSEIPGDPKVFSCVFAANNSIKELVQLTKISRRGSGLNIEFLEMKWFTLEQMRELADRYLENTGVTFWEEDLDLCFKLTQGYPYFVQKVFSIIYQLKSAGDMPDSYLKQVKEEYQQAFEDVVKAWGDEGMPERTHKKLGQLAQKALNNISSHSLPIIARLAEEFLKKQIS